MSCDVFNKGEFNIHLLVVLSFINGNWDVTLDHGHDLWQWSYQKKWAIAARGLWWLVCVCCVGCACMFKLTIATMWTLHRILKDQPSILLWMPNYPLWFCNDQYWHCLSQMPLCPAARTSAGLHCHWDGQVHTQQYYSLTEFSKCVGLPIVSLSFVFIWLWIIYLGMLHSHHQLAYWGLLDGITHTGAIWPRTFPRSSLSHICHAAATKWGHGSGRVVLTGLKSLSKIVYGIPSCILHSDSFD